MSEALRLADEIMDNMSDEHWNQLHADAAAELRRLHAELERKSDAIQRLWKERDELRSECRTLVRQNGEWQELHAELVEALRQVEGMLKLSPHALSITRAALAKARMGERNGS